MKPKTENRGGAGRGQGRKPGPDAARRKHVIAIKLTAAELEVIERAAELDGHDEIAVFAREHVLAACDALGAR